MLIAIVGQKGLRIGFILPREGLLEIKAEELPSFCSRSLLASESL